MSIMTIEATASAGQTEGCAVNIGPTQRKMREIFGVVALAMGAGLTLALIAWEVAWPWRAATFFPFYAGAVGLLQARKKT